MKERAQLGLVVAAGAAIGGLAGYLFFTDHGRRLRRRLEPSFDEVNRELNRFRETLQKAARAADEGWRLIDEITTGRSTNGPGQTRQVAPF
ncbi:MAG TPA: hypothetical protein VIC33_08250 [Vicinamibacterales bacterium]